MPYGFGIFPVPLHTGQFVPLILPEPSHSGQMTDDGLGGLSNGFGIPVPLLKASLCTRVYSIRNRDHIPF